MGEPVYGWLGPPVREGRGALSGLHRQVSARRRRRDTDATTIAAAITAIATARAIKPELLEVAADTGAAGTTGAVGAEPPVASETRAARECFRVFALTFLGLGGGAADVVVVCECEPLEFCEVEEPLEWPVVEVLRRVDELVRRVSDCVGGALSMYSLPAEEVGATGAGWVVVVVVVWVGVVVVVWVWVAVADGVV